MRLDYVSKKMAHVFQIFALVLVLGVAPLVALSQAVGMVQAQAAGPELEYQNLDGVPYNDRLVFSRIANPESGNNPYPSEPGQTPECCIPRNKFRETVKLRLRNPGNAVLEVSGTIVGPWRIDNSTTLSKRTIQPNTSLDLTVTFIAGGKSVNGNLHLGSLTLQSNDADEPVTRIELAGLSQGVSEGGQEPTLGEIARVFGLTSSITAMGQTLDGSPSQGGKGKFEALGEEVLSPYWRRADPAKPASIVQLAAYHQQGRTETVAWFPKDTKDGGPQAIFTHEGVWGQSILPQLQGKSGFVVEFTPSQVFGFRVGTDWSDPARNSQQASLDESKGCFGKCGHHVRFWPARDRSGATLPDTWIMAMDYTSVYINYDYQDNIYLVKNIRPDGPAPNPTAVGAEPGAASLALDFDKEYPGTLADADGQTTGFVRTQRNKFDEVAATSSYKPADLNLNPGAGTLTVESQDRTNSTSQNGLVNGLVLPFDARSSSFVIASRIVGPLSYLKSGSQQAGIMFGLNHDAYIKLVATVSGGQPTLEFANEQNGLASSVLQRLPLPNAASAQSLELKLYGNPLNGQVRAAYRVVGPGSDTGEVLLPTIVTLSGVQRSQFFDRSANAGIIVHHAGSSQIAPVFDRFAVAAVATPAEPALLLRVDTGADTTWAPPSGWSKDADLYAPSGMPDEPAAGAGGTLPRPQILNALPTNEEVYQTYRGQTGAKIVTYNLPVSGQQTVKVRLHFAELYWGLDGRTGGGQRKFDVSVEGTQVLNDFDIYQSAGGARRAVVVTSENIKVSDGRLTVVLNAAATVGGADNVSLAGIEVLSGATEQPTGTTTPGTTPGTTPVPTPTNPPGNTPPIVRVETYQEIQSGGAVSLDAGASSDAEGHTPLTFEWVQTEGPPVSLTTNGAAVSFPAPATAGKVVLRLTVIDAQGARSSETIVVVVRGTQSSTEPKSTFLSLLSKS